MLLLNLIKLRCSVNVYFVMQIAWKLLVIAKMEFVTFYSIESLLKRFFSFEPFHAFHLNELLLATVLRNWTRQFTELFLSANNLHVKDWGNRSGMLCGFESKLSLAIQLALSWLLKDFSSISLIPIQLCIMKTPSIRAVGDVLS